MSFFKQYTVTEHINHLKALRRARCCYIAPASDDFCDCKYGGDLSERLPTGEQTGCPEIRSLIEFLEEGEPNDQSFKR